MKLLPLLPLLLLACTLTAPLAPATPTASATPVSATPSPTDARLFQAGTSEPATCIVATGPEDGKLNLRSGPATSFRVLRVLREGDTLTLLTPGTWPRVRTADGLTGYVNSNFLECEP